MKEHCKTCLWNVYASSNDGVSPFCDWICEPIEDEENETCFDWEVEDET